MLLLNRFADHMVEGEEPINVTVQPQTVIKGGSDGGSEGTNQDVIVAKEDVKVDVGGKDVTAYVRSISLKHENKHQHQHGLAFGGKIDRKSVIKAGILEISIAVRSVLIGLGLGVLQEEA
jgi:hypothetical protein